MSWTLKDVVKGTFVGTVSGFAGGAAGAAAAAALGLLVPPLGVSIAGAIIGTAVVLGIGGGLLERLAAGYPRMAAAVAPRMAEAEVAVAMTRRPPPIRKRTQAMTQAAVTQVTPMHSSGDKE